MFKIVKKKGQKVIIFIALSFMLNVFHTVPAYAIESDINNLYLYTYSISNFIKDYDTVKHKDVSDVIEKTAEFMQKNITNPNVSSFGGEWTILGLSRSGLEVQKKYYDDYYHNVEKYVKEKSGILHHVKYTEYSRVILGLTSIGKDVRNVAGYDLTKPLADYNTLIKQGINGPIFALIALDSKDYKIPVDESVKTQTTRDMLINFILDREIPGGGWALRDDQSQADPDITAMSIQALTPYYGMYEEVKTAVDRGIQWLSDNQSKDGGYKSWGSLNSESTSQVIVALTGLGIDPHNDPRFIKDGNSTINALLGFAAPKGGFYHTKSGEVDLMSTEQAMYALVSYNRFVKGQSRLYDMTMRNKDY